jgi:hypothetical protein
VHIDDIDDDDADEADAGGEADNEEDADDTFSFRLCEPLLLLPTIRLFVISWIDGFIRHVVEPWP